MTTVEISGTTTSNPNTFTFTSDPNLTSVRAKFFVKSVEVFSITPPSRKIVLAAVYSQDPMDENKAFWDATPSGELTMIVNVYRAAEFFKPGQVYFLDFTIPPPIVMSGAAVTGAPAQG